MRFRVGGNFVNREDFIGYNDDEIAKGFGGSFGLLLYFPFGKDNFIAGATIDIWNMWTDWKDSINSPHPTAGKTYNLVLQPWVNGGYLFNLSDRWNTGVSLGFEREINVITRAEKVGEG